MKNRKIERTERGLPCAVLFELKKWKYHVEEK
jgi:hypothetical protein